MSPVELSENNVCVGFFYVYVYVAGRRRKNGTRDPDLETVTASWKSVTRTEAEKDRLKSMNELMSLFEHLLIRLAAIEVPNVKYYSTGDLCGRWSFTTAKLGKRIGH